jgi:hypothetical protein
LSEAAIRNAKPREKPYKLFDERGLFMLMVPTGGRLWRFRYRHGGKGRSSCRSAPIPTSHCVVRARSGMRLDGCKEGNRNAEGRDRPREQALQRAGEIAAQELIRYKP